MKKIPGFVDLQVNGFCGVDFSSPELTPESLARSAEALLRRGTAAFLPTLISSPPETYRRNLPLIAEAVKSSEFAGRLLGIHLEGPFISPEPGAVGAHDPRYVLPPNIDLFHELCDLADGTVKLITIAAEAPGAEELAREAVARGVVVSLGHQLAGEEEILRLAGAGATGLTHLGNGVPNMVHRFRNPIWAGLAAEGLSAMLIADGHHLPAPVLKVFVRAKGADKVIVVSDSAPLAGLPPGRYTTLGNEVVLEESGLLHNPAKGCMVGSSATMLQCMNHLASLGLLRVGDLLKVGFYNPLHLIGVEPGSLTAHTHLRFDAKNAVFSV